MPDSDETVVSGVDVLSRVFDGMSQEVKADAVRALLASSSSTSTRVLGLDVLRALGVPTDRVIGVALDMRPRGEVSRLTVTYAVHGDEATGAICSSLKTWRVVPADVGVEAPCRKPAAEGEPEGVRDGPGASS